MINQEHLKEVEVSKYRKKPIVIEAFMYGIEPCPYWFQHKVSTNEIITLGNVCHIHTLEGVMKACQKLYKKIWKMLGEMG